MGASSRERSPLPAELDVLVVGAGFGGLYASTASAAWA